MSRFCGRVLLFPLFFAAVPLTGGAAHYSPATETRGFRSCVGSIAAINDPEGTIKVELASGELTTLKLDEHLSLVFDGLRMLDIKDLHPGAQVAIDYKILEDKVTPTVTWIEVLTEDPEESFHTQGSP
jgi:hypothetical protein